MCLVLVPAVIGCGARELPAPFELDAAPQTSDGPIAPRDADPVDSGSADASPLDSGGGRDAGMTFPDADPPDLGPPDTGVAPDAGFNFDSGSNACPTFNAVPARVDFGTLAEGMPRTQFFQIINLVL